MIFTLTWIDISAIVGAAAATAALLQVFNKPKTVFALVKHTKLPPLLNLTFQGHWCAPTSKRLISCKA